MDEDASIRFEVYADADWASKSSRRKSANAALMYMNGMLVSWYCNKQALVALSTIKIEFVSAANGIREAMGCYHLAKESGQPTKLPIQLRRDNQDNE
jgi:hypothetical protein